MEEESPDARWPSRAKHAALDGKPPFCGQKRSETRSELYKSQLFASAKIWARNGLMRKFVQIRGCAKVGVGVLGCDPGRHLQECSGAWAGKCHKCLSSDFRHLPRSAPRSAFRVLFGGFLVPKSAKKHSLGHSEAGAQNHSKSTPRGTFRPGPLSTPVKGSRDRKSWVQFVYVWCEV